MADIDPSLFGGTPDVGEVQLQPGAAGSLIQPTPANPQPSGAGFAKTADAAEGAAVRAAGDRERGTILESMGAAITQWDTMRLLDRFQAPEDVPEKDYQFSTFMAQVPMKLTKDEEDYLQKAKSTDGAKYRLEYLQSMRQAAQVSSDHGVASFIVSALDPVYFATTPLTAGAGSVLKFGRLATAATAAGVAVGVQAAGEGPRSDMELILNGLFNAAPAAMLYKPGKGLVKADPDFPDEALSTTLTKPHVRLVTPAQYVDEEVGAAQAVYEMRQVAIPREVSFSKPNYGYRGDNFSLQFASELDKAAYIVAGKGKSAAHASILEWAVRTSGKTEQEIVQAGNTIRDDLKARFKATGAGGGAMMGRDAVNIPKVFDFKPKVERVLVSPEVKGTIQRKLVQEAVYEEVPDALRPGTIKDPVAVANVVEKHLDAEIKNSWGEKLQWNMRKTMSNFGPVGKKVADLLYDNNSDLSLNSVESHKAAVRSDLTAMQRVYEDGMRGALAEDGFGIWQRILSPKKASARQAQIEDELAQEMYRREQLTRQGRPVTYEDVSPRIKAMADNLDKLHARALKELKAAGVEGAEDLVAKAGWHHRKWSSSKIDDMEAKFVAAGKTAEQAHQEVVKLVGLSLRRANGWDRQMAYDIGAAIVNRAKRKGYFEDTLFNSAAGEGTMKQMRDLLHAEGVGGPRLERILDVLRQQTDDAGKAGFMKHRVELDYSASAFVDGKQLRIFDLLDNRMTTVVDQYLDGVSSQVAFALKGMRKASDIEDLRTELLHDIKDPQQRAAAKELFDNTINSLQGRPAGQAVNDNLRLMSSYGRMISLANSGIWQATEYAKMMQQYGVLKTTKYALAEMPGFRGLMETAAKDKRVSSHLKDVLTRHSDQNLRIRPFTHRFEDNFEMGTNSAMHLSAQQAGQLVPYFNVMKFIHGHQARVSSNLIVNRLEMAANGDKKVAAMLERYGIGGQVMDKLKRDFLAHGANIDKWSDSTWADVRPAFGKMMDEAVLHQRLGDMPAFAQFDQVGKFLFTYRSFVLTSHNKALAGGMSREGLGAVSLMMAYQFPLAAVAVQAQSVLQGKGGLTVDDMAKKAGGQMGSMGLFSEIWGIASGNKNSWGSPGLIPVDRAIGAASKAFAGDATGAGGALAQMIPLFSLLQPTRAAINYTKE